MTLYRYCSQVRYALDAVEFGRLYCASTDQLNDPAEGGFINECINTWGQVGNDRLRGTVELMGKMRVCSMTTRNDFAIWAYYGGGFRGAALEVEIPDYDLSEVEYAGSGFLPAYEDEDPRSLAGKVLSVKREEWQHEKEYRIVRHENELDQGLYYMLPTKVRRVILGSKVEAVDIGLLAKACTREDVELAIAIIGSGQGAQPIRHLELPRVWIPPSRED